MKNILVVLGHPSLNSLNRKIADSYFDGAKKNFQVKKLYLPEIKFDPVLHEGYNKVQDLEKDLVKAQELIKWANHLVFVYPIWWLNPPAILKGFIDRVFLPGFAFKYKEKSPYPVRYLKGKSASVINTVGGPRILYILLGWLIKRPFTWGFLTFCGIKSKNQKYFCSINKNLTKERFEKIILKTKIWGEKGI